MFVTDLKLTFLRLKVKIKFDGKFPGDSCFFFFVIARAQSVLKSFHLVKGEKSVSMKE